MNLTTSEEHSTPGYFWATSSSSKMQGLLAEDVSLFTKQLLTGTTAFIVVIAILQYFHNNKTESRYSKNILNLPGPWGLPYFGNIHQLGPLPHRSLTKMWKKYGDIFQVRLPNNPVVVLCGQKTIREALLRQGNVFADRPHFKSLALPASGHSLTGGHFSAKWRLQKKLTFKALFSLDTQADKPMEQLVLEESQALLKRLEKNQGVIYTEPIISDVISKIMFKMMFGRGLGIEDIRHQILDKMNIFFKLFPFLQLNDMMPTFGKYFLSRLFSRGKAVVEEVSALFMTLLKQKRDTYDGVIHTTTDAYISIANRIPAEGHCSGLTREQLLCSMEDMFGAGNFTLGSIIPYVIRYMAKYPDIQRKVQDELKTVFGVSPVTWEHKHHLPYTEATIAEVLRHASVVPLGIPLCTTEDTYFQGYFIPQKTLVFVNLYSANHDPEMWDEPEQFNPDRFLMDDGSFNKSLQDRNIGIFSVGKRKCIGEAIATKILFIMVCALMQRADFREDKSHPIDMGEKLTFAMAPNPFKVKVTVKDECTK